MIDSTPPKDRAGDPISEGIPSTVAIEPRPLGPNDLGARKYTLREAVELTHLALVVGREAANQPAIAMQAVACSIRNRVRANLVKRWGSGYLGVITAPWQYSSIEGSQSDPNLRKYISFDQKPWPIVLSVAQLVYDNVTIDNTNGADSYFDRSLDRNPPKWAIDGEFILCADIGSFHFYKLASLR